MPTYFDDPNPNSTGVRYFEDEAEPGKIPSPRVSPDAGAKAGAKLGSVLIRSLRGTPGGAYGEIFRALEAGGKSLLGKKSYTDERNAIRTEEGISLDPVEREKQIEQIQQQDYATSALNIVGVPKPVWGGKGGPMSEDLGARAERAAVRSGFGDRTAFRKAFRGNKERVQETGRFLLDEKIPLNPRAMKERTETILRNEAGPEVGRISATTPGAVDLAALRDAILAQREVRSLGRNPLTKADYNQIENFFDTLIKQDGQYASPARLHEYRQFLDSGGANWTQAARTAVNDAWIGARQGVSRELGEVMREGGAGADWVAANKRYENAASANKIASTGTERLSGNQFLRPTEKLVAGLSGVAAVGDAVASGNLGRAGKTAMLPLAYIAINRFGVPVAAHGMNAMSKLPIDWLARQAGPLYVGSPKTQEELIAELLRRKKELADAQSE